jgi:site-specific recombinase XerC
MMDAGADAALVEQYLEHVRVGKRLAQRTVELYSLDLQKLAGERARRPASRWSGCRPRTSAAGWRRCTAPAAAAAASR